MYSWLNNVYCLLGPKLQLVTGSACYQLTHASPLVVSLTILLARQFLTYWGNLPGKYRFGCVCPAWSQMSSIGFKSGLQVSHSDSVLTTSSMNLSVCVIYSLFLGKFNSEQLLFEKFFYKIGIFSSFLPWSESSVQFQYIIFQTWQSLEPYRSTLWGDRHMCPLTFSLEIQFGTTFIWNIFFYNRHFWQRLAVN